MLVLGVDSELLRSSTSLEPLRLEWSGREQDTKFSQFDTNRDTLCQYNEKDAKNGISFAPVMCM